MDKGKSCVFFVFSQLLLLISSPVGHSYLTLPILKCAWNATVSENTVWNFAFYPWLKYSIFDIWHIYQDSENNREIERERGRERERLPLRGIKCGSQRFRDVIDANPSHGESGLLLTARGDHSHPVSYLISIWRLQIQGLFRIFKQI